MADKKPRSGRAEAARARRQKDESEDEPDGAEAAIPSEGAPPPSASRTPATAADSDPPPAPAKKKAEAKDTKPSKPAPKPAPANKDDDEDDSDDDEDEDEDDAFSAKDGDDEDEERDESTKGVAKALGVDGDDEEEGEEEEEDAESKAAVANRAARRREEALRRRASRDAKGQPSAAAKKKATLAEVEDEVVAKAKDPLPKDRNARAKELLKRRQESVEKSKNIGLTAGEVVQDQLARAASRTTGWLRKNFRYVVAGLVLTIGSVVGVMYYLDRQEQSRGRASDALASAVANERGDIVVEGEEQPEDPAAQAIGKIDPKPSFKDTSARADAALAAYTKVVDEHKGSGAAILARLGKAGVLLDKGDVDGALSAFGEVLETELAKQDVDVKARAYEGKGFALEQKKDYDGALAAFRDLESADKSFEDLGRYHQGRMHLKKGDKDKAKELFVALYKKLELPTTDGLPRVMKTFVETYLKVIDPALVPKKIINQPKTPEELQEYIRQLQEKQQHGGDDDGEGPPGMPPGMPGMPKMPQMPPQGAPGAPPPIEIEVPEEPPSGGEDDGTR